MLTVLKRSRGARARALTGVKLASAGLGFLLVAVLSKSLGADVFGLVAMSLSAAALFAVVGGYGQQNVLVRGLPGATRSEASAVMLRASARSLAMVAAMVLVFALATRFVWAGHGQVWALGTGALAVGFVASELASHAARGMGAHFAAVLPRDIFWRVFCIVAFAALAETGVASIGLTYLVLAASLGVVVIAQIVGVVRLTLALPEGPGGAEAPYENSRALWVGSVSALFLANVDSLIVGLIFGPKLAGAYFLVNRMAQFLGFIAVGEHQSVSPDIARAYREKGNVAVERIAQAASGRMTKATCVGWAVAMVLIHPVLGLLNVSFAPAHWVMFWLGAAAVTNAALGPGDIVLNMTGHERIACRTAILSMFAGVLFLALGAWLAGPVGVSAGVFVATLLRKSLFFRDVLRHMSIRPARLPGAMTHVSRLWVRP